MSFIKKRRKGGIVDLQCGVVLACRQAGMGKKAGKSVPSTTLRTSILRELGEKVRFSGKEAAFYIRQEIKVSHLMRINLLIVGCIRK